MSSGRDNNGAAATGLSTSLKNIIKIHLSAEVQITDQSLNVELSTHLPNCKVTSIAIDGNNKVFKVSDGEKSYALIIGVRHPTAEKAYESLKSSSWVTRENTKQALEDTEGLRSSNSDNVKNIGFIPLGELAQHGSLTSAFDKIHYDHLRPGGTTQNAPELTTIATQVKSIGLQIANALSDISAKGFIFTDMKAGNFLLREDNTICISDFKSFTTPGKLPSKSVDVDITPTYISRDYKERYDSISRENITDHEKQAKRITLLEQEQSAAMASMLYLIATGKDVQMSAKHKDEKDPLKRRVQQKNYEFTEPLFKNQHPQGDNLKKLIEGLSSEDPTKRIPIGKVRELLLMIDKPVNDFNKKFEEIDANKARIHQERYLANILAIKLECLNNAKDAYNADKRFFKDKTQLNSAKKEYEEAEKNYAESIGLKGGKSTEAKPKKDTSTAPILDRIKQLKVKKIDHNQQIQDEQPTKADNISPAVAENKEDKKISSEKKSSFRP